VVPPHGATTWCHHPGPLTLPKSARNKEPPEAAPHYLDFFLIMEPRYKNKKRTNTKNKDKVFLHKTRFFENDSVRQGSTFSPAVATCATHNPL